MKHRQRGMTFLGIVIILFILGTAVYAGMRLLPVYLEYMEVARALNQLVDEYGNNETNAQMIRRSLERHWDVEDIKSIGYKEIEIQKTNEGYDVRANYEVEQPFVASVFLLVKFDKLVSIPQR